MKPRVAAPSVLPSLLAWATAAALLRSTPCIASARKITGIMRKVDPLPIPVVRNSTRKHTKNPENWPAEEPEGRK
ncbi:MAG: hypothetical protein ACD_23C00542G0001 [uncultured bacterium]|nr:MAG: hypothetical protein ACD_23C00542G0001 [uncultured bacterium]